MTPESIIITGMTVKRTTMDINGRHLLVAHDPLIAKKFSNPIHDRMSMKSVGRVKFLQVLSCA